MRKGNIITRLGIAALMLTAPAAFAQDIHFSQFDMQPLVVNPAFTGMFFGKVRANAIYRNQWKSVTVPYVTYGASVDLPIKTERNGDYLAAGLQMYKDQAGDANLSNFTGLLSIAYHKTFGGGSDDYSGSDLAVGLQGGYAQKSIDLSKLYFGDEFVNGSFIKGTTQEYGSGGLANSVNYAVINAGISFAHAFNSSFSFVLGAAANNLNQPNDAILRKKNSDVGLAMRYTGELGIVWNVSEKLSLRPAVLFQTQASAVEMILGNEFHYNIGSQYSDVNFTPAIFVGGWLRGGDAAMLTAGLEIKNVRVGIAYDYNTSSLNTASNGNGGFEIALKYISPYSIMHTRRSVPCPRF